ncbi:VOC family protein [Paralimibaculum aggregatum]|uniref:VOC family protein n=1 Tax=Paralimibaculum aggregatum TaxID=3036245 RepID=A0ABQ6LIQ1_9RHOB|nr:VOC family protein [Limibaculum sp. NKW23]GMG83161.1 VOC family protein [Limibaculum sp. NKW23]
MFGNIRRFAAGAALALCLPALAGAQVAGLRGIQHFGLTVPDIAEAVDYFVDVIGCESFFSNAIGPFDNGWMMENLDVNDAASLTNHRVRCANGTNLELFEYSSPDQRRVMPKNVDYGGSHIAFYVDDLPATVAYLRGKGLEVFGEIKTNTREGHPTKGLSWIYTRAPWGGYIEFLSYPDGLGYEKTTDRRLWSPLD